MSEHDFHENVLKIEKRSWSWNGVTVADVHEYTKGEVVHPLVNLNETGLAIALEEVGGVTEPRLKPDQACRVDYHPNHMALVPKGMELWGHATKELYYSRYAVLLFDLQCLEGNLQADFTFRAFETPRLRYVNPKVHELVQMLIAIPQGETASQLLGDSLTSAIFALLSSPHNDNYRSTAKRLSHDEVKLVTDYMRDQLPRKIELRELSELVGQSQWHLCRAFRASTGLSPYQWQLEERILMVRRLLLHSEVPLEAIAVSTGFSDAMQMGRIFKQRTGQTPGACRRNFRL